METREKEAVKKKGDRYKWVVIAACFLMVMTALGFCSSPKSLFISSITTALGIDRSVFSINDSLRYIVTAVVSVFFGALVMRFGARRLIAAGFLCLVGSSLCFALADHVAYIYLGGILLGAGFSVTCTNMVGYVVNKWCRENKGTIMGLVLAANGVGGALATQIVSPLIESQATRVSLLPSVFGGSILGYQKAYLVIAAVVLLVGILVVALFREAPSSASCEQSATKKKGRADGNLTLEGAKNRMWFWALLVCVFFTGFTLNGIAGVSAQHMKDVGLSPTFVATVLSVHSLSVAGFKFATGFIYDRFGLRITVTTCTSVGAVVLIFLAMLTNSVQGMVFALIYGIFSSLAIPMETVVLPIYTGEFFSESSFGKALGIISAVNTAGYAVGAFTMNLIFDLTGSYRAGLFLGSAIMAIVMIALQFIIRSANRQCALERSSDTEA